MSSLQNLLKTIDNTGLLKNIRKNIRKTLQQFKIRKTGNST